MPGMLGKNAESAGQNRTEELLHRKFTAAYIYDPEFGIVNILKYFTINSLKNLKNLALKEDTGRLLQKLIREYAAYHLDASDLKSEKLI